jgi:hypothetical protein
MPIVESARVENDQGRAFMLRYRYQLAYLLQHVAAVLQTTSNFSHSLVVNVLYAETDFVIHTGLVDFNHRCPPFQSTVLTHSGEY